jgi:hypothetical protein
VFHAATPRGLRAALVERELEAVAGAREVGAHAQVDVQAALA